METAETIKTYLLNYQHTGELPTPAYHAIMRYLKIHLNQEARTNPLTPEASEDILSKFWLKLHRMKCNGHRFFAKLSQYQAPAMLAYLKQMIRSLGSDHYRQLPKHEQLCEFNGHDLPEYMASLTSPYQPDQQLCVIAAKDKYQRLLLQLNPRQQMLVKLLFEEDLNLTEAARQMDCSVSTCHALKQQTLRLFRA